MPRISMELLRKRSEHNEGEISTLEELSLHQENIEKIELLNEACRDLKILLLQYNLVSKIENLHKLKKLEYLNLALNNIEAIENLEALESLKKLDLTVNFIGDLRGVRSLRHNEHLEQLILTGNPCCDYEGYRQYVVATLPQLEQLDMKTIERSERIVALQKYAEVEDQVVDGYRDYARVRQAQKERRAHENKEQAEDEQFWNAPSEHSPEERVAIARKAMQRSTAKNEDDRPKKQPPKLFNDEGRANNVNQPKVAFRLNDEDDPEYITLEVSLYKHLDTSFVDVDVQPSYVRVCIKGKTLQLRLPCEVQTDRSVASRNLITGSLLIKMPRVEKIARLSAKCTDAKTTVKVKSNSSSSSRQLLEVGPAKSNDKRRDEEQHFVDDPQVPPLDCCLP